jgi:putative proteasome-type protease
MTYCVGMRLNSGLVFLADSRSNAGVDHISTVRKMTVFERRGDRVLVLMCGGNLAVTQAVSQLLSEPSRVENLWTVTSVAKGAEVVGEAIREIYRRDGGSMQQFGLEFNCSFILGGQIAGEDCRLFNIYSAGNFIEAHAESPYFQIGEFKYGKPIIDRVVTPETAVGCCREVRVDLDGFNPALKYFSRHAARFADLRAGFAPGYKIRHRKLR